MTPKIGLLLLPLVFSPFAAPSAFAQSDPNQKSTPAELVEAAIRMPLEALAITDHDTFAGYDRALPQKGLVWPRRIT